MQQFFGSNNIPVVFAFTVIQIQKLFGTGRLNYVATSLRQFITYVLTPNPTVHIFLSRGIGEGFQLPSQMPEQRRVVRLAAANHVVDVHALRIQEPHRRLEDELGTGEMWPLDAIGNHQKSDVLNNIVLDV